MTEARNKIEESVESILAHINEDPKREGLLETPKRVAKMYDEIFSGYKTDVASLFKTFDSEGYQDLVVVKDIEYFSMCEHHMLPFFGQAHIAYIPSDKIVGLSKLGRVVEAFARRLQVQERLSQQIADAIEEHLSPKSLIVVIEGTHLCMAMRGVKKSTSRTITTVTRGEFDGDDSNKRKDEFFSLINSCK